VSDKLPDPLRVDHLKIVDHAHAIFGSVSFIKVFQTGTGKLITFGRAVLPFAFGELFTVFDYTFPAIS